MDSNDIAIIGGGPAGYVAAIHAAHLGAKVVLIEKNKLGGTCLNYGCIPTKVLVKSAEVVSEVKRAFDYGINIDNFEIDFGAIINRKNTIVNRLRKGIEQLITSNKIAFYQGTGRIVAPGVIRVNDQEIRARKIIIATGSQPAILPLIGIDLPGVYSTDDVLDDERLPQSIVIIGGGNVGMEFACMYSALGTKVTILEKLTSCLQFLDHDLKNRFIQILSKRGMEIKTAVSVKCIKREGSMLKVTYDQSGLEQKVECDKVLIATGRWPYTKEIGLDALGVEMVGRCIKVNQYLETNINGIYAVGDVSSRLMLAYVASYEGRIAVENALNMPKKVEYRAIPKCIFTQPEIAFVGLSEEEASTSNIPYKVSKFPIHTSEKAMVDGETLGLVKLICQAETNQVIGMHVFGLHASDLILQGAFAIQFGMTAKDLVNIIPAHPTMSEALHEAAMGQLTGAIHFH